MLRPITIALLTATLLVSCKSDNPQPRGVLVTEMDRRNDVTVQSDPFIGIRFTYNSFGQIEEIFEGFGTEGSGTTDYIYSDGHLASITYSHPSIDSWGTYTLTYDGDALDQIKFERLTLVGGKVEETTTLHYDNSERPTGAIESIFRFSFGPPAEVINWVFEYDERGNLVHAVGTNDDGEVVKEVTQTFDDKPNPFFGKYYGFTNLEFEFYTSPNNVVTRTLVDGSNTEVAEYEYTHDGDFVTSFKATRNYNGWQSSDHMVFLYD